MVLMLKYLGTKKSKTSSSDFFLTGSNKATHTVQYLCFNALKNIKQKCIEVVTSYITEVVVIQTVSIQK